jgi:uncharacterized protein (DUF3820 family)
MYYPTPTITDATPMPFGRFKGKAMRDIPAHYLLYIYNKGWVRYEGVRKYIQDNLQYLNKEAQTKH